MRDADAVIHYDFMYQSAKRDGDMLIYLAPDGTVTMHALEVVVTSKTVAISAS
ncbi:MAG: hypothetical protein ACJAVT_002745 [Yoonia sp.]